MKQLYRTSLWSVLLSLTAVGLQAQEEPAANYRRSSLYSVLVNHDDQKFGEEIKTAFLAMPVPDKYNDHDLSVKVVTIQDKIKKDDQFLINDFLTGNQVAGRLVARWFNRDPFTGQCDMELVKERGLYNASEFDKAIAAQTQRGQAMLADAGEELIGNTFVLVNDIRYIDRGKGSKALGSILRIGGMLAGAMTGNSDFTDLGDNLGSLTESYKGFKVKINTYLYRLAWNQEAANSFYTAQYSAVPDQTKHANFMEARGGYQLNYVGKQESSGSNVSFIGINEDEPLLMVRKACQRALDENVTSLQKEFEFFKTKSPLVSVSPLTAYVGKKEGVTDQSRFEVLEQQEDEQGRRSYKRVGIIKPVASRIWDNRYMALEEGAEGANLGFTTFKKVSGGDFLPGMLIRELK
ncbi:MAG: hypothetical protein LBM06_03685 [Prevotellaceae bacterium]|jgi:hypothetical protein|nr:hypothetical protein [Prevotellaceae bacterium]